MTHRQFLAWGRWTKDQWNAPDRADHYAMQAAQASGGGNLGEYRLKFKFGRPRKLTMEEATQFAKAKWFHAVGYKPDA